MGSRERSGRRGESTPIVETRRVVSPPAALDVSPATDPSIEIDGSARWRRRSSARTRRAGCRRATRAAGRGLNHATQATAATVDNALAAVDDLYTRQRRARRAPRRCCPGARQTGSNPRPASSPGIPVTARPNPRAFYAGARIAETVGLDLDDVRLSARKGILQIYDKGEPVSARFRSTPQRPYPYHKPPQD
jgi:hypothetical protein